MKQAINHNTNMIREIQKLNKDRKKYRLAIHLMTSHIALDLYLNKIGIVNSNLYAIWKKIMWNIILPSVPFSTICDKNILLFIMQH